MNDRIEVFKYFDKEDKDFILALIEHYDNATDERIEQIILKILELYTNPKLFVNSYTPEIDIPKTRIKYVKTN